MKGLGHPRERGGGLFVLQVEVALHLDHGLRSDVVLEELRVLEEELDVRLSRWEHEQEKVRRDDGEHGEPAQRGEPVRVAVEVLAVRA